MLARLTAWLRRRALRRNQPYPDPDGPRSLAHNAAVEAARAEMLARRPLDATVRVEEVADAAIAVHLFRRKFGREVPDFPRHFVALIGRDCVGYIHYTAWQGDYLVGGLCIDERIYGTLSPLQRAWVHDRGGIAEILLRASHAALGDAVALWDYVIDDPARVVNERVGFEPVAEPYLYVLWRKPIGDEAKRRRIEDAKGLGAF